MPGISRHLVRTALRVEGAIGALVADPVAGLERERAETRKLAARRVVPPPTRRWRMTFSDATLAPLSRPVPRATWKRPLDERTIRELSESAIGLRRLPSRRGLRTLPLGRPLPGHDRPRTVDPCTRQRGPLRERPGRGQDRRHRSRGPPGARSRARRRVTCRPGGGR